MITSYIFKDSIVRRLERQETRQPDVAPTVRVSCQPYAILLIFLRIAVLHCWLGSFTVLLARLFQLFHGNIVHVIKVLIFTGHAPDESIVDCADA